MFIENESLIRYTKEPTIPISRQQTQSTPAATGTGANGTKIKDSYFGSNGIFNFY